MQDQTIDESAVTLTPENYIFALDIGTRSIIGIVGYQTAGDLFHIVAVEMKEHPHRAMADGQIEDIRQVSRTAEQVKNQLEQQIGFALTKVNVAAAGRALRTGTAEFQLDVNTGEGITEQQIHELEMGAISLVREQLDRENDSDRFYCVGHSVTRYFLDDYPFSTILGHRGSLARAQVIATFLPAAVVDSLCAAMAQIGCEISNLTLEPIAAMNAVIPAELRLLNLALVDIGAGTSDIAVCENGSVTGYTMATVAGDEMTEELIRRYLVDFQTAERMKHAAARGDTEVTYSDILGFEYTVPLDEMITTLRPAIEQLSAEICDRIINVNTRAPAAVFLVGGGSLAPLLCEQVADRLEIDRKKVAVGGNNFIRRVAVASEDLSGPEYATPIGIALTAASMGEQSGFHVYINGKKVRLFRNDVMAVLDVLLLCGYQYNELLGRSGRSINYHLNGQKMILRGEHLTPAQIWVNDQEASVSTQIVGEDRIDVIPAENGADASLTLEELGHAPQEFQVTLNGVPYTAGRRVLVNGRPALPDQLEVHDLDVIQTLEVFTVAALCAQADIDPHGKVFGLNGEQSAPEEALKPGDMVVCVSLSGGDEIRPVFRPWPPVEQQPLDLPESQPETVPVTEPVIVTESVVRIPEPVVAVPEPVVVTPDPVVVTPEPVVVVPEPVAVAPEPVAVTPEPVVVVPEPVAVTPEPVVVVPEPVAVTPDPVVIVPEPVVVVPEPVVVTPEPVAVVPEPVAVAPEPVVVTPEPVVVAPEPVVVAPEPVAVTPEQAVAPAAQPSPTPAPVIAKPTMKVTLNDNPVLLTAKEDKMPYQFIDMLNLVDLDPTRPQGNIILLLNGKSASYLDEVRNGDVVEIRWENS